MSDSNYIDVDAILSQCRASFDFEVNQLFKLGGTVYTVTPWYGEPSGYSNHCDKCAFKNKICGAIKCNDVYRNDNQDVIVVVNPIDK